MPKRTGIGQGQGFDPLYTGKIYHVYSRTIAGVEVFTEDESKYAYLFLKILRHCMKYDTSFSVHGKQSKGMGEEFHKLQNPKSINDDPSRVLPVKIHAYVIMPNHFHLLVEQLVDDGISFFIGRILKSFSKIYNRESTRKGALWEGKFRAKLIADEKDYLQVIRYIHLNPIKSTRLGVGDLDSYEFSSYLDAIGKRNSWLCDHTYLQNLFTSPSEYEEFVHTQIAPGDQMHAESLAIEEPFAG